MSVEGKVERGEVAGEESLESLGIEPHQLASARNPETRIGELVASHAARSRPARPWKGQAGLAEAILERLGKAVHVRIG